MATVHDKHKLKDLLKWLIEQAHYQAVVSHVIAKKIKAETHHPIEDINAAFAEMHEMREEAWTTCSAAAASRSSPKASADSRSLGAKRPLAHREFSLGLEALLGPANQALSP